jgi:preprotein translocase subunit SecF
MAFKPLRFFSNEGRFNFMGHRWVAFTITGIMVLGSIFLLATKGLNWGIDFTGGVLMEIQTTEPADLGKLRALFPAQEFGDVSLQHFGNEKDVMIRLPLKGDEEQNVVVGRVKEKLAQSGYAITYRKIDYVGPAVGQEMIRSGILAFVLAIIGIVAYVAIRFEWQYAVGAVTTLVHDFASVMGFYSLTGLEFNLSSIAAVLTVVGYSINDTVVVYDRIREMRRKFRKMPIADIINKSVNVTLSRTILTSFTTLLAVVALVTFGGDVIRGFAASILFGILVGTYSSIFVSAPVLIYTRLGSGEKAEEAVA